MCVCEREREKERGRQWVRVFSLLFHVWLTPCVCFPVSSLFLYYFYFYFVIVIFYYLIFFVFAFYWRKMGWAEYQWSSRFERVRKKTKHNWLPIAVSKFNSCFLGIRVFFGFLSVHTFIRFCLDMKNLRFQNFHCRRICVGVFANFSLILFRNQTIYFPSLFK